MKKTDSNLQNKEATFSWLVWWEIDPFVLVLQGLKDSRTPLWSEASNYGIHNLGRWWVQCCRKYWHDLISVERAKTHQQNTSECAVLLPRSFLVCYLECDGNNFSQYKRDAQSCEPATGVRDAVECVAFSNLDPGKGILGAPGIDWSGIMKSGQLWGPLSFAQEKGERADSAGLGLDTWE